MDVGVLDYWRQAIKRILSHCASAPVPTEGNLEYKTVFDGNSDNYLVIQHGWNQVKRLHRIRIDVEIKNDKIWIQCDNTEGSVARELLAAGIPKDKIVLGFKTPKSRVLTGFGVT